MQELSLWRQIPMSDDTKEDADSHDLMIRILDRLRIRLIFMTELYPFFISIFSIIFYIYIYFINIRLIVQLLLFILYLKNAKTSLRDNI